MKNFLKNVFANIVAILIIGGIIFGFFIISLIASASDGEVKSVKENSILIINLKENIKESNNDFQESILSLKKPKQNRYFDILLAIKEAKSDSRIKGISIETDNTSAGITQLDDIRAAIEDFKKSGKFVYAYGNMVSQPAYYLGSVADKFYLNPVGGIELKGLATEVTYIKDFADKYGIGIDVIRHGKFKSAVEPYLRNDISPENKEQLSVLLNDIWGNISNKIQTSRKLTPEALKITVDSLYGIIPDLALKNKLTDQLIQKVQYEYILKSKLGLKKEDDLKKISLYDYINSKLDEDDTPSDENQIAVLYASGQIFNGKGDSNIYSDNLIQQIKKIKDNDNIKAVVLRVNSPGGSANASDEILYSLQELKAKKPLIVSFGDYAASGGYYISMAADKIYASPNTLTGSIGVFGVIPNFKNIANKNGIRADAVETNANSKFYSAISGPASGTLDILQKSIEQTYKRFVYFVSQNRKKTFEQIDNVGGGRVWSGTKAKELGLVDELGSLQDAINYASSKANIKNYKLNIYPKEISPVERFFSDEEEDELANSYLKHKIGKENFEMFQKITNPKLQSNIQMENPFYINIK